MLLRLHQPYAVHFLGYGSTIIQVFYPYLLVLIKHLLDRDTCQFSVGVPIVELLDESTRRQSLVEQIGLVEVQLLILGGKVELVYVLQE